MILWKTRRDRRRALDPAQRARAAAAGDAVEVASVDAWLAAHRTVR